MKAQANGGCQRNATQQEFTKTANIAQQIFPSAGDDDDDNHAAAILIDTHNSNSSSSSAASQQQRHQPRSRRRSRCRFSVQPFVIVVVVVCTVMSLGSAGIAVPAEQPTAPPTPQLTAGSATTTRLRRHDSNIRAMYVHEMRRHQSPNWANPCVGMWEQPDQNRTSAEVAVKAMRRPRRLPTKLRLLKLQRTLYMELTDISSTPTTHAMNISNIRDYSLHSYRFLPRLRAKSNIALRRWHRQLQIFVGGFDYLFRAQLHLDYHKKQYLSDEAMELRKLKQSARHVLCEIELAINYTANGRRASAHRPLTVVSRSAMEERLRFQTHLAHVHQQQLRPINDDIESTDKVQLYAVNWIDLRLCKERYFVYLRAMIKVLRSHTRRAGASRSGSLRPSGSAQQLSSRMSSGGSIELPDPQKRSRGRHLKRKSPLKTRLRAKSHNAK